MRHFSKASCLAASLYLVIASFSLLVLGSPISTNAQSPPLTPPPPSAGSTPSASSKAIADDHTPPALELQTTELKEGKNVISLTITDESSLTSRIVKYVNQGKIKISDIAKDNGNHYSALVNVKGPTAILVFEVIDANGNLGKVVKEFSVLPQNTNIFDQFVEWITSLFSNFGR